MPVLKIKKNGVWEHVSGISRHVHAKEDIINLEEKIYTQPDEPTDAPVGSVWVDTDEDVGFGGGGSTSIDVTASVGQTIVVEEVDANGKPTKWKAAEYPLVTNEIIPQIIYTPQYDNSYGCYMFSFATDTALTEGHKYIVVFDGVEYQCTAKIAAVGNMAAIYIGNGVIAGDNTGEPFSLMDVYGYDGYLTMANFDGNEHTISLSDVKLTDAYVPKSAYPYYIEATAEWDAVASDADLINLVFTNKASDAIKAFESGREIKLRLSTSGGTGNYEEYSSIYDLCVTRLKTSTVGKVLELVFFCGVDIAIGIKNALCGNVPAWLHVMAILRADGSIDEIVPGSLD